MKNCTNERTAKENFGEYQPRLLFGKTSILISNSHSNLKYKKPPPKKLRPNLVIPNYSVICGQIGGQRRRYLDRIWLKTPLKNFK